MFFAAAFVLFCAACAVLAFTRHPMYGLYFYYATFFVNPPSRWWNYMVPDLRWSLLSAVVAVLAVIFHRGRLAPKPPWINSGAAILLLMYGVWMWIQSPWALDPAEHLDGSTKFLKYLVAFWLVYRLTDSKESLRNVLFGHAAGCLLLAVLAQFAGRDGDRLDGVGGPGVDEANALGMYLATGVLAMLGLFMTNTGWRKWGCLAMMVIIANGFVLANSRGAFLGLAAGVVVVLICKAREHRRSFWVLMLVGALGSTAIVDTTFVERMFTIGDVTSTSEDADASARSRLAIYEAQLRMSADYPFGAGYRGTVVLSRTYLDRRWFARNNGLDDPSAARSSHNTVMTTLVEQGWPGFVMFTFLLGWIALAILRVRRMNARGVDPDVITLAAACCAGLAVVMVAGLATDYLMAEVQFWLFGALASALQLGSGVPESQPKAGSAAPLRPLPGLQR
jgi:O-antigen ligase